jgi:hypothetical protein
MIRQAFAAMALASIVGCSANSGLSNPFARNRQEQAQLAAYAARTPYPGQTQAQEAHRIGALISPKNDRIEVVNFGDQPLHNVNLWVNGSFLYRIDVIPSQSTRSVGPSELYDTNGQTMASLKTTPNRVELQSGDHLWTLPTATGH